MRDGVTVLPVQGAVYMIEGAGGNIAVQIGSDGIVLVDTGSGAKSKEVLAALGDLTSDPIRYIINTGPGSDHVGGNAALAAAGQSLAFRGRGGRGGPPGGRGRGGPPGAAPAGPPGANDPSAPIVGPDPLLSRMSKTYPLAAWPTEVFLEGEAKNFFLNDEAVQVFRQPAAHSDSDSMVLFRRSDVVVSGEIFDLTRFPVIDVEKGGTIQGELDALNALMHLAVSSAPLPYKHGGTRIIPAHGRIAEQAEVVEYRDMVTIIRDRVQALMKEKKTLAEIQAANPAAGYRTRFGADSGDWTTAKFIETIYRTVKP